VRIAFFAMSKRRTRTTGSIAAALRRAGHEVLWVDERRRRRLLGASAARRTALRAVARFRPGLVLVHASDVSMATLEELSPRERTALFTPDCWREPLGGDALERARRVDLVLTVARGQLPLLRAAGVRRAAWLPEACDPAVHFPAARAPRAWHCDVAFIGKANPDSERHAARRELVAAVSRRFDTHLYGAGWEKVHLAAARRDVGPRGYRLACRGARIVLGRDWTDACEAYFSNRTWFTLGCGGFLLTNYVPGLEGIFESGRELLWYRSEDECLALIERFLAQPEERRRIAEAGHAFVRAHRSHDHFARDLVALVEGREPEFAASAWGRRGAAGSAGAEGPSRGYG
jgi:hypothetical protein